MTEKMTEEELRERLSRIEEELKKKGFLNSCSKWYCYVIIIFVAIFVFVFMFLFTG